MAIKLPIPDPLQLDTPNRGCVTMKWLTVGSITQLEALRREHDAAGFLMHGLSIHMLEPQVSVTELATWAPEDIRAVAQGWSEYIHAFDRELGDGATADAFARAFDAYQQEFGQRMRDAIPPMFESIRLQNKQFETMLGPAHAIQQAIRSLELQQSLWQTTWSRQFEQYHRPFLDAQLAFDPFDSSAHIASGLAAAFSKNFGFRTSLAPQLPALTEALRISASHQTLLSSVGIEHAKWRPITDRLAEGIRSLTTLSRNVLGEWAAGGALPGDIVAREAPVVELYTASTASAALVGGAIESPPGSIEATLDALSLQIEPGLSRLDARLVCLYRGALNALVNGGADHVRHFAVSLRELLTHAIHRLAPDTELRAWPGAAPDDFPNGRPSRRLRLRYIFREVNGTSYAAFIGDDVKRTIDMIDMLNADTHRLFTEADPRALRLVLRRVEGLMAILLEATAR